MLRAALALALVLASSAELITLHSQDTERPSGGAQHRTFFLFGAAGGAQPRAAGFVSRLELRPGLALRPVPGLEALLGPRFYVNTGGVDASLAPVPPFGGLFSSASERREAERQTSWVDEQLDLLEGLQAAFLAARPRGHHCGGMGRGAAARDDLPSMTSYLASARFGPALLSSYARQAQEYNDAEGDEGEEVDGGEEVEVLYEEADEAGPIEGAWGPGEYLEDGGVGEAEEALGAPQTGLFFVMRNALAAPADAPRATWVAPGAGGPVNWSLWLDDDSPNYGLGVFLALAVACTAVWASLAGQLARAMCGTLRAPAPPAAPAGGKAWSAREKAPLLEPLAQEKASVYDDMPPLVHADQLPSVEAASAAQWGHAPIKQYVLLKTDA